MDIISAYLFILVLTVLFILIKNNEVIQGLDIINYRFLYSAYADDSTFFLRNIDSVIELAMTFKGFPSFSNLCLSVKLLVSEIRKGLKQQPAV